MRAWIVQIQIRLLSYLFFVDVKRLYMPVLFCMEILPEALIVFYNGSVGVGSSQYNDTALPIEKLHFKDKAVSRPYYIGNGISWKIHWNMLFIYNETTEVYTAFAPRLTSQHVMHEE